MEKSTSTIRYSLRASNLRVPNAPAYTARVHGYKTITREQLIAAKGLQDFVEKDARTERVRATIRNPEVDYVYDFTTEAVNGSLTPGRMAELKGCNLFLNGTDRAEGSYFTREGTKDTLKVDKINRKTSGTLLFTVPEGMSPGTYKLCVRSRFGTDLREGGLKQLLSVN